MRSRAALFVLTIVLAGGIIQILRLRVQSNDLLPEYSTRRTDPNGLSVLFDSLEGTGAIPVTRSNRPPSLIQNADATLVFAGVDLFNQLGGDSTISELEALAGKGNRVVVAVSRAPSRFEKVRPVWDVHLIAMPRTDSEDDDDEPLRWPAYFQAGPEWQVNRSEKDHPVVIERKFATGSVVLFASTWPLTNEAMVQDRRTELLAALFNGKPGVIFDESHLGLEESGTVMALSHRFHLQGFLAGLLLLSCLFVWSNLAGFPPDRSFPAARTGRDSLSGLSILLARNVPEKNLIDACLSERRKSGGTMLRPDQLDQVRGAAIEKFQAIRHELHDTRQRRHQPYE